MICMSQRKRWTSFQFRYGCTNGLVFALGRRGVSRVAGLKRASSQTLLPDQVPGVCGTRVIRDEMNK